MESGPLIMPPTMDFGGKMAVSKSLLRRRMYVAVGKRSLPRHEDRHQFQCRGRQIRFFMSAPTSGYAQQKFGGRTLLGPRRSGESCPHYSVTSSPWFQTRATTMRHRALVLRASRLGPQPSRNCRSTVGRRGTPTGKTSPASRARALVAPRLRGIRAGVCWDPDMTNGATVGQRWAGRRETDTS